jgi:hypothetical protein
MLERVPETERRMIAAFVAVLSLNLTLSLVQDYGVIYKTLPITGATVTTPIIVTSAAHGVAMASRIHGVVTGVGGTSEANGLWILTPTDADHFSLTALDAQGNLIESVGVNAYASGGQIQWAFPDGQILLGRRLKNLATAVATPRIVFIPTTGRGWGFEPYGGAAPSITPAEVPNVRGGPEQQAMTTEPQLATEFPTFEVYVNGTGVNYGNALDPDFADFEATQALVHALYAQLFDAVGGLPRAKILRESWPSQDEKQGAMTQRGQQWMGILEIQQPVRTVPQTFVPEGVRLTITVVPVDPASGDATTITIT